MNILPPAPLWAIVRSAGVLTPAVWGLLAGYYVLTPLTAAADGAAWLLLAHALAPDSVSGASGPLLPALKAVGLPSSASGILTWAGLLFLGKAALTFGMTMLETALAAQTRKRLQVAGLRALLQGRWDELSSQHVGRWTGALTEEAGLLTKYLASAVSASYALLTAAILGGMALLLAPRTALLVAVAGIPVWLALKSLYLLQTRLSRKQAEARQGFASDLTECLTGLFQIKAASSQAPASERALRRQDDIVRTDMQLGATSAAMTAFNALAVGAALLLAAAWQARSPEAAAAALGGVGILLFRAASQLNVMNAMLSNLSRLAGSVEPFHRLIVIPPEPRREPLPEPLASIRLESVSLRLGERVVIAGASLAVEPGRMLLITGPSGAGKTTLVNLIAGLYTPSSGRAVYKGVSGREYDARSYRARLGYVAQDVHLLSGTLRDNLDPERRAADADLWRYLEAAGAAVFVRALGGLDAGIAEAGRSLSGGEKRRLAIARALAQDADCLLLDEVTNGLDHDVKTALVQTIDRLSRTVLVVAVTHDLAAFAGSEMTRFELAPS